MYTLIIVEDEYIIRKGLVHTIDWFELGFKVIGEAEDGVEGLRLIKELKPDLIITDIRMPNKNGLDMIAEAKKTVNFESIILTSYSHFDYAKEAITLGVSSYVLKPIDEKELLEIVKGIKTKINDKKVVQNIKFHKNNEGELDFTNLKLYIDNDSTNTYVRHALEQIRKGYNEKISIEGIAEELLISPSYLSRKFKTDTGYTFLELLNKYRIQKSIDIILKEKGRYRVYEISDMVGFTDYKHYCTVFKKYTNLSPKDFINGESIVLK